ncbi:MAG: prohibitin family protein [Bacteroidales bacterium]|nr:prohibitin family protein [Bacteroidales bacterium]
MNQQQVPGELNMKKVFPIAIIFGAIILLVIFWSRMTVTVGAGQSGVLFNTFGKGINLEQAPLGEGFHFIAPWNKVYLYSVRQKEKAENMKMLSSNGLEISIDVSAWFWPVNEKLPYLHKKIGSDFEMQVVIPAMRAAARSVIGRYTPEEIYSTKRDAIQDEMYVETKKILDEKYVYLDRMLIRSVILPQSIKGAIESKLKQEQLALEYKFKLRRAEKEAERMRIAAEGEAAANKIINSSLTKELLRMRGIEATIKLSESQNAKTIIIGSGKDGLPLILGGSN